jgi:FlaA1/EpsC-like NDP-sugar epimerase
MSDVAIRVENLSKQYRIGGKQARYRTVRESLVEAARVPFRRLPSVVRFGNVLGSRGSVVPTFSRQIERGGPMTITHPHMERFFMSVQEAASLVIQAGAYTTGGDLFVLDMGEEVRIEEVARKVIRLRGLRAGRDIQTAFPGVRPSEKLSEILSCPVCEVLEPTHHSSILRVQNHHELPLGDLTSQVGRMIDLARQGTGDPGELRTLLFEIARLLCPEACTCAQDVPTRWVP